MKRLIFIVFCLISLSSFAGGFLFEENKGQWHAEVLYRTEIPGGYFYITRSGMKYLYIDPVDAERLSGHNHHTSNPTLRSGYGNNQYVTIQAIEMNFEGISDTLQFTGQSPAKSYSNYFKGSDPQKWQSEVRKFEKVIIEDIYPGIDIVYYSMEGYLKYDLILAPNANPQAINMMFSGASGIQLLDGQIIVKSEFGQSVEQKPFAFQTAKTGRKEVKCQYLLNDNSISFEFPDGYDHRSELIIDPALIFSTYSGSLADNWGFTATYDDEGNLYSGGIVREMGFPTQVGVIQEDFEGLVDIGILKFDSLGQELIYATYIGGTDSETPQSIVVDHNGDLVVYGTTSSWNFPITQNAYQDVLLGGTPLNQRYPIDSLGPPVGGVPFNFGSDLYILKISPDGRDLRASTYVGGSENDGLMLHGQPLTKNYGDQFRGEVVVDESNNILITTSTSSTDFPIVNGFQPAYGGGSHDGVIVKLTSNLEKIMWSSFLGGSDMDGIYSIKQDTKGNIIVGGGSISNDFPTTPQSHKPNNAIVGNIDGVVTKIDPEGVQILASTYVGTGAYDQVFFVDVDSSDNIYVLGQTQGDYPVTQGVYSNPNSGQFIHKLGSNLDSTYFSTVFGSGSGSPNIRPSAFLVNECENLLISGWGGATNSSLGVNSYVGGNTFNMPITDDAFQKTTDGSDFYLMVLLKDATQLLYGTYFGGDNSTDHVDGGTSRFDEKGIVYQSVCASCRDSNDDFPTTEGAWSSTDQSQFPSPNCNNAVFKFDVASLDARLATNTKEFDNPGIREGCYPLEIMFLNESIGGVDFYWTFGNGEETAKKDSILITYEDPGTYNVSLSARDINTCIREDYDYGLITVYDQEFNIMDSTSICFGDEIRLSAGGADSYLWTPDEFLSNPQAPNPIAKPDTTTYFKVLMTNEFGCDYLDSVRIRVIPDFTVDFSIEKWPDCFQTPEVFLKNQSTLTDSLVWNLGDGTVLHADSLVYNYEDTDTFNITLRGLLEVCEKTISKPVTSVETFIPNIITPNGDGKNDHFIVITDELIDLEIYNRWGNTVFEKVSYQGEFDGSGLSPGLYYYNVTFKTNRKQCNGWLQVMK